MGFYDIVRDRLSEEEFRIITALALGILGLSTMTEWSQLWTVEAGTSASHVLVERANVDYTHNFAALFFETPSRVRREKERLIGTGDIQSFC